MLESNHDLEMLRAGPYPFMLKKRILGMEGHLSNIVAAEYAVSSVRAGTRQLLLAHLSDQNNTPRLALETASQALKEAGLTVRLSVAPRDTMSEALVLEGETCKK